MAAARFFSLLRVDVNPLSATDDIYALYSYFLYARFDDTLHFVRS